MNDEKTFNLACASKQVASLASLQRSHCRLLPKMAREIRELMLFCWGWLLQYVSFTLFDSLLIQYEHDASRQITQD